MRIAINGMGRIGRLLFRRLIHHPEIELVAVNDIMPTDNLAYLLKYDSVYGTFENEIVIAERSFVVNNKKVAALQTADPAKLRWKEMNIDVVIECTGKFTTADTAGLHLKAGAGSITVNNGFSRYSINDLWF